MRNSSSKLIILSFLVVLCLFAFYKVTKYYSNQDIKPIIKDNINVADEKINNSTANGLGDTQGTSDELACYANAATLSTATDAEWTTASKRKVGNSYKIDSVKTESDCKVQEKDPLYCPPANKTCVSENKSTNTCDDTLTIEYKDGLTCDGKPIYEVDCNNKSTVKFDYNDDNVATTKSLYAGQGFKYSIVVTTIKTCNVKFNKDTWKTAYETIVTKINSTSDASEKQRLNKKKTELENLISTYNSYTPNNSYNETAAISMEYKVMGKSKTNEENFDVTIVQNGTGKISGEEAVSLGYTINGISQVKNYKWSNEKNPRKVKLILPKAYIDAKTGDISTSGLDGGNKFYLDYNIDPGTYNMNVKVSGVGCNSGVNNNKCNVKVEDLEIIYRPIDISNPFINNKWTPGTNWINSQFDFRNIIHSDIWSK